MIERAFRGAGWLLGFLMATLVPLGAVGQGGTDGSIAGYVSDPAGRPISGVTIVASSTTQIDGARSATSNRKGGFRLLQLFPGTFRVTASAPGHRTVVHEHVFVGISAPAEVNIVLEATSRDEAPRVVDMTPTVGTTTSHVQEVFDQAFLEVMPLPGRHRVLEQLVGQAGGAVGHRIRGGSSNQTVFIQDGFDTRARYPVSQAAAAYEIQSAGYGADDATASGALVNLVTRIGSNRWQVDVDATAENATLRFRDQGAPSGSYHYRMSPAVAGPLLRDKLWLALAVESHVLGQARVPDPEGMLPGAPPHLRLSNLGTLKVTWQIDARNRLAFLSNFESGFGSNLKRDVGAAEEAQQNWREGLSGLWGVIWEALLMDGIVFRSQAGYSQRPQYWYPALCEDGRPGTCDATPAVVHLFPRRTERHNAAFGCPDAGECVDGRASPHRREDVRAFQTFNRLDYFLETELVGEHHLQLKHRFYTEKEVRRQAQPGDYFDEHSDPDLPVARTTFYANDPHFDTGRSGWWIGTAVGYRSNASLGDTWRPTRHLTFTAAVSHIWSRGQNSARATVLDDTTWAPSVAGVWDATHDGRTAVRGSHSQYVDADVRTPIMHTIGAQASRRCLWNPTAQSYDQDCVQSGGLSRNTVGSPCGPTGLDDAGQPCLQRLTLPRTREYTLGVEREVLPAVGLSLDLIYRAFGNRYELRETNRIWNPSGTAVLGYRNGRPETVIDVDTPGSARGTYRGMTLALDKRRGPLRTAFSYTLSDLRGTAFWGTSDPFLITPGVPAEGPEADDRRHAVKASAAWAASAWLSIGLRYQYGSGFPVDPFYRNEVTGTYERNLRDLRTPAAQALDLQVRFMLAPAAGHRLDLYAEALGLLNVRPAIDDASIFGGDTTGTPLRLRLGVSYRL